MSPKRPSLPALLLVVVSGLLAACDTADERPVRVVLITLDTTRADALLTDGATPPLENVYRWSQLGLVFERHYAATGETQPSHATMFTGMHPWRHGLTLNSAALGEHHETLAERLQASGFRTGAVVASHPLESRYGFGQGFDLYVEDFSEGALAAQRGFSSADVVAEQAHSVLDQLGGDRQFLWFHFFDAHAPYGALTRPPAQRMRPTDMRVAVTDQGADRDEILARGLELYHSDIRIMDGHIDTLLERLEQESADFETHIVIVADHGENFGETGSLGHGKRLTRLDLHVPLVILSPRVEAGVRREPVGMIDVTATLLDLAGVDGELGTSRSLLDDDQRRRVVGMRRIFMEPFTETRLDGSVHTIEGLRFFSVIGDRIYMGNSQEIVLDDMDPREPEADRVAELEVLFREFEDEIVDPDLSLVDDEMIEQMRALGYVQ